MSYYRTPEVVTYRYPLLRPRTAVVRVYPGVTAASYYPSVVLP